MAAWDLGLLVLEDSIPVSTEIARSAERAGFSSVWGTEFHNRNGLVRLAALAAATDRIAIASGITFAFGRTPPLTASGAADLDELSNGRFLLGLGTGTKRMNEDWYGIPFSHPAPRLTELVRLLRALWAHERGRFSFEGRFYRIVIDRYSRPGMVRRDIPVFTAGVNPRMVRVAGEVADGVVGHPIFTTRYLREVARPALEEGARRAGRDPSAVKIASEIITVISDDPEQARQEARLQVAFYSTVRTYDIILDLHGFQEEKERIRDAFRRNDPQAMAAAVSDRMLAEMAVCGTAGQVIEQMERYRGLVDIPILYTPTFGVPVARVRENHRLLIETFAPERAR